MKLIDKPCRQCGQVFTRERKVQPFCSVECHFWSKVDRRGVDECWIWGGTKNSEGYGIVSDNHRTLLAHRISCEIKHGPLGKQLVLHKCDNPPCVNPEHLVPGTQADNVADRIAKGRSRYVSRPNRGEASHMAKLATAEVIEMRKMHDSGIRLRDIAIYYPAVSRGAIWRIIHRKNWRHV